MKHALLTMVGLALTLPAWSQQIPPVVISDASRAPQIEIPEGAFEITVPNLGTLPVAAPPGQALELEPSQIDLFELDDAAIEELVTSQLELELDDVELELRDGGESEEMTAAITTGPRSGRIIVIARSGDRRDVTPAPMAAEGSRAACASAAPHRMIVSVGPHVSMLERAPSAAIVERMPSESTVERAPSTSIVERVPSMSIVERVPNVSTVERAPVARRVIVRVVGDDSERTDGGAPVDAQAKMPAPQISEYSRPEPPLPSAAELLEATKAGYSLSSPAPNPVSTTASISFTLPRAGRAVLAVYDNAGRVVATLADETLDAGTHTRTFDAGGLPAGLYLYRLSSGSFAETKTMTVVR